MNTQDDFQPNYPMNRRTFVGMVAAGAAGTVFQAISPRPSFPIPCPVPVTRI